MHNTYCKIINLYYSTFTSYTCTYKLSYLSLKMKFTVYLICCLFFNVLVITEAHEICQGKKEIIAFITFTARIYFFSFS